VVHAPVKALDRMREKVLFLLFEVSIQACSATQETQSSYLQLLEYVTLDNGEPVRPLAAHILDPVCP
jgi:hypothetical protein